MLIASSETQSFLHDPAHKIDTFYTSDEFQPYKDNTGRQLRHILVNGSARWAITALTCILYAGATIIWQNKVAISETSKRLYNTITTGVSIAMGLNVASAFKDMALNMRWVILSNRKRNLIEMDLILHADSMQRLFKLVFVTRRPMVILGALFWLFVNILAQAGIAMISLTYGFNPDVNHLTYSPGLVAIPDMSLFQPPGNISDPHPSFRDQAYTAHVYGESAYNQGVESSPAPAAGTVYQTNSTIWFPDNTTFVQFVFADSPTDSIYPSSTSVYTSRRINSTYACDVFNVTAGGDGLSPQIEVDKLGNVTLHQPVVPNALNVWVAANSECEGSPRCQVVQAFEAYTDGPYYYTCNISVSRTYDDPLNVSFVSDQMAQIAASSMALTGFGDANEASGQAYPPESDWGLPEGDSDLMGSYMSLFAIGAIAGAAENNLYTSYQGQVPGSGQFLEVGHQKLFYLILGAITGSHLFFLLLVAYLANRVKVGPEEALSMALLLRPIADALDGVSGGKENQALKDAKKNTMVRYEKGPNGKWKVNMS
ncbi:hypothetical protein N431DRAFT_350702 [Stipitochalara longipes BDJ]|nr:hypothetical protein N431DRAFT_350702 [Stipitochalara longipes BDJ]